MKNRLLQFICTLVCIVPSLAFSSTHEGFMAFDEKHLKKVAKKLTCDDNAFDKVFPPCNQHNVDQTVGKIVRSDGGLGTGMIIDSDGLRATGITAKHVLFQKGSKPLQAVYGRFLQSSMRISGSDKTTLLATLKIDEVLIDPKSKKDIALFKGKYTKKDPLFSAVATPVVEQSRKRKHIKIHHYPLSAQDQRRNKGELDQDNHETHYVSTLPGSSGAPILTKSGDALIGIHTGAGAKIKKVKYTGDRLKNFKGDEFSLSKSNRYVGISKDELSGFTKSFKMVAKKGKKKVQSKK